VDRPAADIDRRVAETYDDQVRRGLRDEILGLNERYDVESQYRRLGQKSPNQVVHTHGYTEWFDVALDRGKPVENLSSAELDEVRERVVERIQTHTRRQRSAIPKLTGVKMVRGARDAFDAVAAAAAAGPVSSNGGRPGGDRPGGGSGGGRSRGSRSGRSDGSARSGAERSDGGGRSGGAGSAGAGRPRRDVDAGGNRQPRQGKPKRPPKR
jgi:tRNA dimethylallyltransferase